MEIASKSTHTAARLTGAAGRKSRWKFRALASAHLVLLVALVALVGQRALTVTIKQYDKLERREFLQLDWEVVEFYNETNEALDQRQLNYDEQLYRSIRALRHTTVVNMLDYFYSNNETARRSAGAQVDAELCERQLSLLVRMAARAAGRSSGARVPLSALNFFESSGKVESGALNGNFIWWGSFASCRRARVPAGSANRFLEASERRLEGDIDSRYCVAHLKAASWPKWDKYFEERLRIRQALCLPRACHTSVWLDSARARRAVDYLARNSLAHPFNTDRYAVSYLYCLPDEDSEFRRWDFGTKLFVLFAAAWSGLLLYTNAKYHRRLRALRDLRATVDIRMVINQTRESASDQDEPEAGRPEPEELASWRSLMPPAGGSRASSASASPLPSDIEENDGEFNIIRPIVTGRLKRLKKRPGDAGQHSQPADFVKAFSVKSNIDHLFRSRASETAAKVTESSGAKGSPATLESSVTAKRLSQQLSFVSRRISSSNEALIRDLSKDEAKSKVALVSADREGSPDSDQTDGDQVEVSGPNKRRKRVDVDIFDGIKAFCTCYIVYGHTLMFFFGLLSDLRFADERMLDLNVIAVLNTLQVVGLFYIVTGILITYLAFSRTKADQLKRPTFWLLVIAGRYMRLMPAYLLVFWFARHVAPYTGSGPVWYDYRTDDEQARGICGQQTWWPTLTMSSADVKIPFDCIPQAWYLSNDFRTLLILPFYIVLLATNQRAGYAAILATFVYSSAKLTSILRGANINYQTLLHWQPHVYAIMADRLHDVYTNLSVRLSTYLLGAIIGHLLYLYETRQVRRWPAWFRRNGMKFSLLVGGLTFMGAPMMANPWIYQFLPAAHEVDSDLVVLLIPIFKGAMEISMSVALLLLATSGGPTWLRRVLSSKVAKILSNISYAVFLVHVEVMYKLPALKLWSSYWYLAAYSTFFIVLSNVVGFCLYILYEMPINNLLRHLFKKLLRFSVK